MTTKQRARRARDLAMAVAVARGESLRSVARAFGVSPSTVGRALDRATERAGRVRNFQPLTALRLAS